MAAMAICFRLFMHDARRADSRVAVIAGIASPREGDDRDHHQQLDESKTGRTGRHPTRPRLDS